MKSAEQKAFPKKCIKVNIIRQRPAVGPVIRCGNRRGLQQPSLGGTSFGIRVGHDGWEQVRVERDAIHSGNNDVGAVPLDYRGAKAFGFRSRLATTVGVPILTR